MPPMANPLHGTARKQHAASGHAAAVKGRLDAENPAAHNHSTTTTHRRKHSTTTTDHQSTTSSSTTSSAFLTTSSSSSTPPATTPTAALATSHETAGRAGGMSTSALAGIVAGAGLLLLFAMGSIIAWRRRQTLKHRTAPSSMVPVDKNLPRPPVMIEYPSPLSSARPLWDGTHSRSRSDLSSTPSSLTVKHPYPYPQTPVSAGPPIDQRDAHAIGIAVSQWGGEPIQHARSRSDLLSPLSTESLRAHERAGSQSPSEGERAPPDPSSRWSGSTGAGHATDLKEAFGGHRRAASAIISRMSLKPQKRG